MTVTIYSTSGDVIYRSDRDTIREAVIKAVSTSADLYAAHLPDTDLSRANLSGASLYNANLSGANLSDANMGDALNADHAVAQTRILPEGDLIVWKQCANRHLVKLRIPAEAKRSNGTGRKCRAEYAKVLSITDMNGQPVDEAVSSYDPEFTYTPGSTVRPTTPFDDDMWNECSSGIHFYITRKEAEAHL